jgi:single-strand selective monofunctional uracil DNA glycosylase
MPQDTLCTIAHRLSCEVNRLTFGPPVTHVYNPLDYARRGYEAYVKKYARRKCAVLLLGMNPGPWGMVQTGVPFGEVNIVRDWLGIESSIGKPQHEHPLRPVNGFNCRRSEVSGQRLWGWARDTFQTPRRFFESFFIANYCPLAFIEAGGRNRTPDKLPAAERVPLFHQCDQALRESVEIIAPNFVVGVGAFAAARAREALKGMDVEIGQILHPSPASPAANRDWAGKAALQLQSILGRSFTPVV